MAQTPSEELTQRLCERTFLSLWSIPNPVAKPGKELCDLLVVCGDDILLWSVKDIGIKGAGDTLAEWERWHKKAIEKSAKQLYGAERQLGRMAAVQAKGGGYSLQLPPPERRHMHRIAVALGSKGLGPIGSGDFGSGFIHVLDEESLEILTRELDTIADFTKYLTAKEAFLIGDVQILINGGEENLLAFYIDQGRKFPSGYNLLVVDEGLWEHLVKKPEFARRKDEDKLSYSWDRLITTFHDDFRAGRLEFGQSVDEVDGITRVMAREDRFARRVVAKAFWEFMDLAGQKKISSRTMVSPSGVVYVFLALPFGEPRAYRKAELAARCFIARSMNQGSTDVVGIATEQYKMGQGFSLDAMLLHKPDWSADDEARTKELQATTGFFSNPLISRSHDDEFPAADS